MEKLNKNAFDEYTESVKKEAYSELLQEVYDLLNVDYLTPYYIETTLAEKYGVKLDTGKGERI